MENWKRKYDNDFCNGAARPALLDTSLTRLRGSAKNELENEMGQKWLREIERLLPEKEHLRILDVGTGTGFFAVLLAQAGHQVEGIDLTPAMLEEARSLAAQRNLDIVFREMDAQALSYAEESFDVVLSRNLTWTLPEPEKAYREWFRVLKPGGWLLNFDADYAANVRSHSMQNCKVAPDSPYGHIGMTDALQQENDEITLTMDIGQLRPAWDMRVLRRIGFPTAGQMQQSGSESLERWI